jgi:uncharacterized membrane protein YraQ (UPF0718 family)/copper chaperone CopZ
MILFLDTFFALYLEMVPYLALGLFVAGVLHISVNRTFIISHFGNGGVYSVIKASLLGVPLPLCSCSVVPTAMSLKKHGASDGATISFLISTPQTGVESIAATWGMMGPLFAIFRPLAAFVTGVFGGVITTYSNNSNEVVVKDRSIEKEKTYSSLLDRLKELFRYGFSELMDDIGINLLIGILVSALITILIPDSFFAENIGNSFLEMILVILGGVPLYICSTASIPIAAALIIKGISPSAAFVFLIVGPATNAATITVIYSKMGRKMALIYLGSIVSLAIPFGFLLNWFYDILEIDPTGFMSHLHSKEISLFSLLVTVFFSVALLYSLWKVLGRGAVKRVFKMFNKVEIGETQNYGVTGMTCKNCARHVQEEVERIDGVSDVVVNLEDKEIRVMGSVDILDIQKAVEKAGYNFTGVAE